MKDEKQRVYYRLAYPDSCRPKLVMDFQDYEIEDVSEYGVKVKIDDDLTFMADDTVMATIAFPDGKEFDLIGKVVRVEQGYAGLHLDAPLPLELIRAEAEYVIKETGEG